MFCILFLLLYCDISHTQCILSEKPLDTINQRCWFLIFYIWPKIFTLWKSKNLLFSHRQNCNRDLGKRFKHIVTNTETWKIHSLNFYWLQCKRWYAGVKLPGNINNRYTLRMIHECNWTCLFVFTFFHRNSHVLHFIMQSCS